MKLYSYFRSSAAFRVRIALNLKQQKFTTIPVHLLEGGGQQRTPEYLDKNPQGLVPTLITDDGDIITQSLAIIEYLDETVPQPPLLPDNSLERAHVRAFCHAITSDIHPLNNLRVLQHLAAELGSNEAQKNAWYQHWIKVGFTAIETNLAQQPPAHKFCFGNRPSIADCCLIPQVYNAERFALAMDAFPTIRKINQHCLSLPEFSKALPKNQPDAA